MTQVAQLTMPAPKPVTVERVEEVILGKVSPIFSLPKSLLVDSLVAAHLPTLDAYLLQEKKEYERKDREMLKKDLLIFTFSGEANQGREITEAFEQECGKEVTFPYLLGALTDYSESLFNALRLGNNLGLCPTIPFGHLALRFCLRRRSNRTDSAFELFQSFTLEKSLYIVAFDKNTVY